MSAPVEFTAKYATTVAELPAAWAFVMEHLDEVGPDPQIQIRPLWIITSADETPRKFEVMVSGMMSDGR